jgi:hypothetical protein
MRKKLKYFFNFCNNLWAGTIFYNYGCEHIEVQHTSRKNGKRFVKYSFIGDKIAMALIFAATLIIAPTVCRMI